MNKLTLFFAVFLWFFSMSSLQAMDVPMVIDDKISISANSKKSYSHSTDSDNLNPFKKRKKDELVILQEKNCQSVNDKLTVEAKSYSQNSQAESLVYENLDNEDLCSKSRQIINLMNLPFDMRVYIFSFLQDQKDFLRARHISKKFRRTVESIWKNKSLNLSGRILNREDYKAIVQGPFSRLILRNVNLGIEEASILAYFPKFTHLDLGFNYIRADSVGKIAAANFLSLTTLCLERNDIGDEGVKKLATANFPALTSLNLSTNKIGHTEVLAVANFPALTSLDLSNNLIRDTGVEKLAIVKFSVLSNLNLTHNSIMGLVLNKLTVVNFPLLTALNLSYNKIKSLGGLESKRSLGTFPTLRSLDLSKNDIEEGIENLTIANFSALTTLNLCSNNIRAKGVRKLAAANFPALTSLNLSTNKIGNEGVETLLAANFPLLATLDLYGNKIGDEGVETLLAANFPLLETLRLANNGIGNNGAQKVSSLPFPLLTNLDLSSNCIGLEEVNKLAVHFYFLTTLEVSGQDDWEV